jgi:hypothetical protein
MAFDGTKSHLGYVAVELKTTMILSCCALEVRLQPRDKSVCGPFKHYWNEQVMLWYNHSSIRRTLTKQRFGNILTEAWNKAATPANMKAGFFATGIYPFIPSIIPDATFAPILVTHSEDAQVSSVVTLIETPTPALLSQKTWKLLLSMVHLAKLRTKQDES